METDPAGNILRFLEKPKPDEITCNTINAGIYVLEPSTFDRIPTDVAWSIERSFFPSFIERGETFLASMYRDYWIDIGTPEKYMQVHRDIMDGRYTTPPFNGQPGLAWVSPTARVDDGARLEGPLFIDDGCVVKAGARIGPYTVLGQDCRVDDDANVSGAIVWADSHIGPEATVPDAIIGRRADRPQRHAARRRARGQDGDRGIQPLMNPDIFKAYDVRGLYPTELDEQIFHQIGRAFVAFLKAKRIGVGRDMRVSSPSLAAAFIEGAREQGADVVDFGMIATDMLYYGVATDDLDGGAQITASHNPKQYNGCKMVGHGNHPAQRRQRHLRYPRHDRRQPDSGRCGDSLEVCSHRSILDGYVKHVMGFIDSSIIKPFNAVLDAGCGMAGLVAPELFKALPCKDDSLCFTIDGTFPTHEANPLIEENRRDIVARVKATSADIGIAWDGDADRCFFIDEDGEFVPGDFVTALLAEAFLLKEPGATIVYDLRASHAVKDVAASYGGKAFMNRVGHAFFKGRMRELNAVFGGEVTGHYYFRDNFYCDNGFIPALLMLELMSKKNKSLKQLLEPLRAKYFISGEINTKMPSMEAMSARSKRSSHYQDAKISKLDGLSVEYPDWHFNVRASNTEPLLRLNLEGTTSELMEQKRDEVLSIIRKA